MMLRCLAAALSLRTAALAAPYIDVTFYKDVLPILRENCQSCHRPGKIAPASFLTYESTQPWASAIKKAVVARQMPPQFTLPRWNHDRFGQFSNGRSLAQADIQTLVEWVDAGAPPGDPNDAPPFAPPDQLEQGAGFVKGQARTPWEQPGPVSVSEIAQKIRFDFDKFWRIPGG
jgi:hypothetical protein